MEIYTQKIIEVRNNGQGLPVRDKFSGEADWTLRLTCKEHGTSGPVCIKGAGFNVIMERAGFRNPVNLVGLGFDSFETNPRAAIYALVLYYTDQTLVKVVEPNWRRV